MSDCLQKRAPRGALMSSVEWLAVADNLNSVAKALRGRMATRGRFNVALATFVADEIEATSAEIRANLALEELTACQNRS